MSQPTGVITAAELRNLGFCVADDIPDNAWMPRMALDPQLLEDIPARELPLMLVRADAMAVPPPRPPGSSHFRYAEGIQ